MNRYAWLEESLLAMPGATRDYKEEWGWWRYQVGGKMFAAICQPDETHAAYAGRELVTLKCEPTLAALVREKYADIVPGFYMNKRCWNSVFLDGTLDEALLRSLCEQSYRLVFEKLTKAVQRELETAGV